MKDSKGNDLAEGDILFNPFFCDMWIVTVKDNGMYAVLINKDCEELLENVCDSFYTVGRIDMKIACKYRESK